MTSADLADTIFSDRSGAMIGERSAVVAFSPVGRRRGGVILLAEQGIAAIERVRDGVRYHLLPGGQCETDEDPATAAAREALEELGVSVRLEGLVAVISFNDAVQYYYLAKELSGTFGTGTGAEMSSPVASEAGSYRAVWLAIKDFETADLRPRPIAKALQEAENPESLLASWLRSPLTIEERP